MAMVAVRESMLWAYPWDPVSEILLLFLYESMVLQSRSRTENNFPTIDRRYIAHYFLRMVGSSTTDR